MLKKSLRICFLFLDIWEKNRFFLIMQIIKKLQK